MINAPQKKEEMVKGVFESIQDKYDMLDSCISFGMDQRWRELLVENLDLQQGNSVLDCGAGTGRLTRAILDKCPGCKTISLDITESMFRPSILPETRFIIASAEEIPLENSSMNAVVSAYLTRNLSSVDRYFSEAYRVLAPGGVFANLDIYNPSMSVFSQLFALYFYHIVPAIGDAVTGTHSYSYLANSVKKFHPPQAITSKLTECGFKNVRTKSLMLGSVYIHVGVK